MKIPVILEIYIVDKPVDSVEKFCFYTAISRKCPFLTPNLGMLIMLLCTPQTLGFRVTETTVSGENFLIFGEKVEICAALVAASSVFSIFSLKTL
ncbi:MAG: hypothetical protein IJE24_05185 [Oscillospiraceae bacterium]|nr:hypothetical protein [Oscillospiraceae bacterium]